MSERVSQEVARLQCEIVELKRQNAQLRGMLAGAIDICDVALRDVISTFNAALSDRPPGKTGRVVSTRGRPHGRACAAACDLQMASLKAEAAPTTRPAVGPAKCVPITRTGPPASSPKIRRRVASAAAGS